MTQKQQRQATAETDQNKEAERVRDSACKVSVRDALAAAYKQIGADAMTISPTIMIDRPKGKIITVTTATFHLSQFEGSNDEREQ